LQGNSTEFFVFIIDNVDPGKTTIL